jgi:DNA-binding PadR family transcriptional regulator
VSSAKLSNVAYVILGFLSTEGAQPLSGYDLKQLVDRSVRFFFAASYGQIYPELKKLANAGLVEGADEAIGGRARTVWSITPAGRKRLREWLVENENRVEMRDEGILRIFFASGLTKEERLRKLHQLRDERVAGLKVIEAIRDEPPEDSLEMPDLVLDYGLGMYHYVIDWCDRAIAAVEAGERLELRR